MTRRSLAQQAKETALKEQRKQTQREVEAQRLNELKSQRRAEEAAAVVIQQRVKVLLAPSTLTRRRRSTIAQQGTSASLLLAQSKGVALLEKMLQRHRAANSVMWEVYTSCASRTRSTTSSGYRRPRATASSTVRCRSASGSLRARSTTRRPGCAR